MELQALMVGIVNPVTDTTGVLAKYDQMVRRSRAERRALKREIALAGTGVVFSVDDLFRLPETNAGSACLPTIAIAHYRMQKVYFLRNSWLSVFRGDEDSYTLRIPTLTDKDFHGSVRVPMVPKSVMPRGFFLKRRTHIMFDTPVWQEEALPIDPILLERIDDKRFRVLAHWDLTPKERQMLALIR